MEIMFLTLLPLALWSQAWGLLGFNTNQRTVGIISASVGIIFLGAVIFSPAALAPATGASASALSLLVLVWAVYALLVGAVGLWGLDERTVGFYSLILAGLSGIYTAYFLLGPILSATGAVSTVLGLVSLMLGVIAALNFFQLAPPYPKLRVVTGWFTLIISIAVVLIGGLAVLGLAL